MVHAYSQDGNVRSRSWGITAVLVAFCVGSLAGTAFAQASHGLISGSVVDPQRAPVPQARVIATNESTIAREITQTDQSGYFVFPEVLPGTYTVSVEMKGFQKIEKTGIVVLPADRISVGNLPLTIGSLQSVITVGGETPPVQTTSSDQSAVITSTEMAYLPSLGRDYMSLTRTLPGSNYIGEGNASLGTTSTQGRFE